MSYLGFISSFHQFSLSETFHVLSEALSAQLAAISGRLQALSPLSTLARGYAVAHTPDGPVIRTVDAVDPGDELRVRLIDGHVDARVTSTTPRTDA